MGSGSTVSVISAISNTVTTTIGVGTALKEWRSPPSAPTVTMISPATGHVAGGISVTITGTGFAAVQPAWRRHRPDRRLRHSGRDRRCWTSQPVHLRLRRLHRPADNPPTINGVNAGQPISMKSSLGTDQVSTSSPSATSPPPRSTAPVHCSTRADGNGAGVPAQARKERLPAARFWARYLAGTVASTGHKALADPAYPVRLLVLTAGARQSAVTPGRVSWSLMGHVCCPGVGRSRCGAGVVLARVVPARPTHWRTGQQLRWMVWSGRG
jgi:hypothetical protein